jgi:uncharacterized protein YecE (DUF72 family)
MVCLEKMINVCEALKASVLHILVPREIRLEGRRMMRARDLFESVSSNRVRIALEIGRGQTHALDLDKVQIMQDLNIVHCVDLSHEEPTYRSDILYARLFGPTGDNRYQFTDEEPKNINTRASKPEFEKSVLAFHGLNYRGLKPAGSSGQSATSRHDSCGLIDLILLTQFLSNLKDGASLLHEQ